MLDLAAEVGIISKSGAWYAYDGNKIGQGRENAKMYLQENPSVCAEIEQKVRAHYNLAGTASEMEGKVSKKSQKEEHIAES